MTLLPLAGWAIDYDVMVMPTDASAAWCGGKPTVQPEWIMISSNSGTANPSKADIAAQLEIKSLNNTNVGDHTYALQKKANANGYVQVGEDKYYIQTSGSNTATLNIEKFEGDLEWGGTLAFVNDNLVYTSQPQALLSSGATATANGFTVPVVYATSETAENWVSWEDLKETNAKTYNVYYKVVGTDNYAGSGVKTMDGTKAIAKATITFNLSAADGLTYNGAPQALLALTINNKPATNFGASTLQYKIDDAEAWAELPEAGIAGITGTSAKNGTAYSVKLKVPASADGNWDETETSIDATIAKATPIFTYVPTHENGGLPTGLVYDTHSHQLVLQEATAIVPGTEISVPLKYSIRRYRNVTGNYTTRTSKPFDQLVGTLASTRYQIRAYNEKTNDLNQVIQELENVVIDKATIPADAYTEPVAKNVRTTGALQSLVDAATWTGETTYGTFQYSLNGTDWSNDVPQGTDVAEYTVYWRILPTVVSDTRNYNIVSGNKTSIITAKSKVTITIPANQSFGYGTTPTLEYTATWEAQGSDVLKEEGLTWTWYTGATGDTQASKVGGYYPAGEYYVMVGGLAVDGTTASSQEIVYPTDRQKVKITAGQIVANISGTATYGSEPTFTLTHVSGLAPADAETLNTNSTVLTVTVKKGDDVLVNGNPATDAIKNQLKALDAYDSYTLEATAEYTPNTNYTLLVNAGTLKVNPNAAYGFTIGDIADVEYKAAKWEPAVTVAGLTKDKDYTVTYGGTVGTTTYDNIKAGEGVVIINGIGNYAGATGSKTFTINKAALTITANNRIGDDAWVYGTAEFTDEYPKYTATVTGLKSDNDYVDGKLAGIADALTVVRTSNETVGMHEGALVAQFGTAQPEESDNYIITYNEGNLQIAKGTVVIKLKEAVDDDTYGEDPDATESIKTAIQNIANYEYVSGLSALEAANFASIIDVSAATYTLASDQYQVGTNYSFAIDGVTSTNYKVTVPEGGIYKVNPSPIKLKAKDQTIDWSADPNATPNTTVSKATSEEDENGTVLVITSDSQPGLQYDDEVTDLIKSIIIQTSKVGENVISLEAKENANYSIIELQNGTLTVTGADVVLMRSVYADADDDEFSTIQSYNGLNKQVKITVNRTYTLPTTSTTYTWKGEDWNAFILPFDIEPKDLSEAFGYAIVNVVNPAATKDGNIAFKLQMSGTIKANTPFMLKNYEAVPENKVIDFGVREIVAPESAEVSIPAGEGIQFIGSYKTKKLGENMSNLYFYNGEGAWKHLKAATTTSWNIAPFNAYMEMPATGGAREYTFTFEELDGGTTAIRSISEDATGTNAKGWYTLNGVKMQNAPTQKGVYIKDGKKVVIK